MAGTTPAIFCLYENKNYSTRGTRFGADIL